MRSFHKNYRLQANSIPEITNALRAIEFRLSKLPKPRNRKAGPILNAILVHFALLSEDEQERLLDESFAKIDQVMARDEDVAIDFRDALGTQGNPDVGPHMEANERGAAAKPPKRKRSVSN